MAPRHAPMLHKTKNLTHARVAPAPGGHSRRLGGFVTAVYTGPPPPSTPDAAPGCCRFVTWHRSVRRDLNVSQVWKLIRRMSSAARGHGLSRLPMTARRMTQAGT